MAEPDQIYRESCRRLHRIVANYFAMQAWCTGADCVVIDRSVLISVLQIDRIKDVRLEWIRADMAPWFQHIHSLNYSERNSVGCVYLSRRPIGQWMNDTMTDDARADLLRRNGVLCIVLESVGARDWSEAGLLTELALLAAGLGTPPCGWS